MRILMPAAACRHYEGPGSSKLVMSPFIYVFKLSSLLSGKEELLATVRLPKEGLEFHSACIVPSCRDLQGGGLCLVGGRVNKLPSRKAFVLCLKDHQLITPVIRCASRHPSAQNYCCDVHMHV